MLGDHALYFLSKSRTCSLRALRHLLRVLPVIAMTLGLVWSASAAAQQSAADRRVAFDIPALPLDAALTQYFRMTGVQLLYDAALTTERRSSAVHGIYTPREALHILLSGAGLTARYSKSNSAILVPIGAASNGALVPLGRVIVRERIAPAHLSQAARMAYYGAIEEQFRDYLSNDRRSGRLAFNTVAAVEIDADGRLATVRIARGSGDDRTNSILTDVLANAIVSPPPEGLTQPLLIVLKGKRR